MRPKVKDINTPIYRLSGDPSNRGANYGANNKYHHGYDPDEDTEDTFSRNVRFAATPDLVFEDMASLIQLCSNTPEHAQASPWAGKRISKKFVDVRYDTDLDSPKRCSPFNSDEEEEEDDYEDLRIRGLKIQNQR